MKQRVEVHTDVVRSARVDQVEGIFDVPRAQRVDIAWDVSLPIEERPWSVGAIIGPSGCGKSTVARACFGPEMAAHEAHLAHLRASRGALVDAFPEGMPIKDIVASLSAVGFSSPPAWVRPFNVLSNGEQFRVAMAYALAVAGMQRPCGTMVVDEFTSVVDRTVARIGSAAIGKAVRRNGQRFIAVTCHEDIVDWLQPEWVYRPSEQQFTWRSVQPRPRVQLTLYRVHHSLWARFRHHHYLTHELNHSAICFAAVADFGEEMGRRLVAFDSWLPFVGRHKGAPIKRGHRLVCLPDYQGIGIANALETVCASMWRGLGFRAVMGTSHPAIIEQRRRNGRGWKMTGVPAMSARDTTDTDKAASRAASRLMARFEYVGPAMPRAQAERVLNNWTTKL